MVDDNSNDGTAKEAESAGAGVLKAGKLPKGALGKPHACMVGAQAIGTKWILFADADTWFEPGVMESLLHAAETPPEDCLICRKARLGLPADLPLPAGLGGGR